MSIAEEIKKLDNLRRDGTLSHEEFEIAKRKVLEGPQDVTESDHLEEIKAQNEVAQLDREWQIEREKYLITGKYGNKHIPGKISSILIGVVTVGFGVFWMGGVASMPGSGLFSLFGLVFILFGAGMGISSFFKAGEYEKAEARYQRRRSLLLRKK